MNWFPLLTSSFSLHLVQVLAHFLWQGFLVALLAAGATWLLRRRSAESRYLTNLGALLLMVLCLPATSVVLQFGGGPASGGIGLEPVPSSVAPIAKPQASLGPSASPGAVGEPMSQMQPMLAAASAGQGRSSESSFTAWSWHVWAPYLTLVYFSGVGLMLIRLVFGLMAGYRFRRHLLPVEDPTLLGILTRQARVLGLRLVPAVAYCERVAVPVLIGVLRPMILLPISLTSNLAIQEIEAILTHELAHLRRYDPLVNFLQRIVEAVLFFHPAVWYVSGQVRREREHCCDDMVVAAGEKPLAYAQSLVRMAELSVRRSRQRLLRWAGSVNSTGDRPSQLRGRILRLLGDVEDSRVRLTRSGILAFAGVLLSGALLAISAVCSNTRAESEKARIQTEETESGEAAQPVKMVCGQVVDEHDQPVAGAKVWLRVKHDQEAFWGRRKSRFTVHAQSDGQGRFRFEVPKSWLKDGPGSELAGMSLWAYADGFQIAGNGEFLPLVLEDKPVDVRLVLGPISETSLVVRDPEGRPLAAATIAPRNYQTKPLCSDLMLQELAEILTTRTDADGRARLRGLSNEKLRAISVSTDRFGEQVQYFHPTVGPNQGLVSLRRTGKVIGRVTAEDPRLVSGLRVGVWTKSDEGSADLEGQAIAVTDEHGFFVVPAIAEGSGQANMLTDERSAVRPQVPQNIRVPADLAAGVEIPLVRVGKGRPAFSDPAKPVPSSGADQKVSAATPVEEQVQKKTQQGTWPLQVPDNIERGMQADRVQPRHKR